MKKAESQVAAQFESGEIGEEQYRAFQREIVTTESKLNNLKNKLDKAGTSFKDLGNDAEKTKKELDDFDKKVDEAEKAMKEAGDSAKQFGEDLAAIGGAAIAGATFAITTANNTERAMNSLQAQTGATDDEMQAFGESMKNLYLENYGEDMEQLADYMARVAQYTGETDPKAIEDMTKNLITLEDTFDMDFSETLRGVDNLMKHMGVDAQTAFDLIAKGAQNGLDKSGELGDNIAEYAQLWGQAGFSAEEMFTILDNGLDAGAYNLDKVNDFVKEFAISLSDGRIEDNIKSFSKDTQKLFSEYKKGKKTAKDVFNSVEKDLKSAKNEQEALTLAGTVWSALGEDNAMSVITSLTNVNDTFKDVKGTMEEVNDVKYDDVGNRFEALGRKMQTEVIEPLGQKLLPYAEKFVDYCINNLDDIIPIATKIGIAFATIFVVKTVSDFVTAVTNLGTAFKSLGTIISANPVGAAIAGVSTLIAVTGAAAAYSQAQLKKEMEATYGLTEEQKKLIKQIEARTESIREANAVRDKENQGIEAEIGHCQNLWKELQGIVDANGKIKKGYEDRAAVITTLLAESLGIEIKIVDGQIQKYDELKQSIDDVIQTKRAEALLDVNKDEYTNAIQEQADAYSEYMKHVEAAAKSEEKLADAQEAYNDAYNAHQSAIGENVDFYSLLELQGNLQKAATALDVASKAHNKNTNALEKAQDNYLEYCNTIQNYEGLMGAVASGDAQQLTDAMNNLSNSFVTADNATEEMLNNQLTTFQTQYEQMKLAVEQGMPGVSQAQVDAMAGMVEAAQLELDKFSEKTYSSGTTAATSFTNGFSATSLLWQQAGASCAYDLDTALKNRDFDATGKVAAHAFAGGVAATSKSASTAGAKVGASADAGMRSPNTQKAGQDKDSFRQLQ